MKIALRLPAAPIELDINDGDDQQKVVSLLHDQGIDVSPAEATQFLRHAREAAKDGTDAVSLDFGVEFPTAVVARGWLQEPSAASVKPQSRDEVLSQATPDASDLAELLDDPVMRLFPNLVPPSSASPIAQPALGATTPADDTATPSASPILPGTASPQVVAQTAGPSTAALTKPHMDASHLLLLGALDELGPATEAAEALQLIRQGLQLSIAQKRGDVAQLQALAAVCNKLRDLNVQDVDAAMALALAKLTRAALGDATLNGQDPRALLDGSAAASGSAPVSVALIGAAAVVTARLVSAVAWLLELLPSAASPEAKRTIASLHALSAVLGAVGDRAVAAPSDTRWGTLIATAASLGRQELDLAAKLSGTSDPAAVMKALAADQVALRRTEQRLRAIDSQIEQMAKLLLPDEAHLHDVSIALEERVQLCLATLSSMKVPSARAERRAPAEWEGVTASPQTVDAKPLVIAPADPKGQMATLRAALARATPGSLEHAELAAKLEGLTHIPESYMQQMMRAGRYWQDKAQTRGNAEVMPGFTGGGLVLDFREVADVYKIDPEHAPVVAHEYGFRGDSRPPDVLFDAGGFHPHAVYATVPPAELYANAKHLPAADGWKLLLDNFDNMLANLKDQHAALVELQQQSSLTPPAAQLQAAIDANVAERARLEQHVGYAKSRQRAGAAMDALIPDAIKGFDAYLHVSDVYNEVSAFVSVSRNVNQGASFAKMHSQQGSPTYVYLVRGEGGIDQNATFRHQNPAENEISMPGGVDFNDIIAFCEFRNGKPVPPVRLNEKNKWRMNDHEKALQDQAVARLLAIK